MITISGNPTPFLGASRAVRQEYGALQRDLSIASARMSNQLVGVGRQATYSLTVPILAAGAAVVKLSMDFDTTMGKIRGLVDVGRSQVQAWKADILSISEATARAPKELADAMYFIASSGFKGAEAMNVLKMSAKAAAAGLGETKDIADALTSVMNAYRSTGLDAAKATDILIAAVREGKGEPADLAKSIGQVVSIAAETKVPFEDLAAAVAGLTDVGLTSSEAVTALKRTILTLIKPTSDAREILKHYHLDVVELREEMSHNFIDALTHVREALQGNVTDAARLFGGMKNVNAVFALTGNNAQQVQKIFKNVENSSGSLDRAFKEMSDTVGFQWKQALNSVAVEAVKLGDVMAPIMLEIAGKIKDVTTWFGNLSMAQKESIVHWLAIVAAIGPLLLIFGEMARTAKILYDAFTLMKTAQVLLGLSMGATATEALSLTSVMKYMWIEIATTPLGAVLLLTAAIAALVYGLHSWANAEKDVADNMHEQNIKEIADSISLAQTKKEQLDRVQELIVQYKDLTTSQNQTSSSARQMTSIQEQVRKLAPDIGKALDKQSQAQGGVNFMMNVAKSIIPGLTGMLDSHRWSVDALGNAYATAGVKAQQALKMIALGKSMDLQEKLGKNAEQISTLESQQEYLKNIQNKSTLYSDATYIPRVIFGTDESGMKANQDQLDTLLREQDQLQAQFTLAEAARQDIGKAAPTTTIPTTTSTGTPWNPYKDTGDPKGGGKGKAGRQPKEDSGLKEYAADATKLQEIIGRLGDTTEKGALQWKYYHGELAQGAVDGKKISDAMRQNIIRLYDEAAAIQKNKKGWDDVRKAVEDQALAHSELHAKTNVEIADAERNTMVNGKRVGKYKDLSDAQYAVIRQQMLLADSDKTQLDFENQLHEAAQRRIDDEKSKVSAIGDSINEMRLAAKRPSTQTHVDQVKESFGDGGEYEGMKTVQILNTTIDLYAQALAAAKALDQHEISIAADDELKKMNEAVAVHEKLATVMNKETETAKMWVKTTVGAYRDLDDITKKLLMDAAAKMDQDTQDDKNKEAHLKATEEYNKKLYDLGQEEQAIRDQMNGGPGKKKFILDDINAMPGADLLNSYQKQKLIEQEEQLRKMKENATTAQTLADATSKIFDNLFSNTHKHFKNMFDAIWTGFRGMLQQMALDYARSQFHQLMLRFFSQIVGGLSGGVGTATTGASNLSDAGGFAATGGSISKPTWTGEEGMELFIPRQYGTVIKNDEVARAIASASHTNKSVLEGVKQGVLAQLGQATAVTRESTEGPAIQVGTIALALPNVRNPEDWKNNKTAMAAEIMNELERHARRSGVKKRR